jgi:hypothetical protein
MPLLILSVGIAEPPPARRAMHCRGIIARLIVTRHALTRAFQINSLSFFFVHRHTSCRHSTRVYLKCIWHGAGRWPARKENALGQRCGLLMNERDDGAPLGIKCIFGYDDFPNARVALYDQDLQGQSRGRRECRGFSGRSPGNQTRYWWSGLQRRSRRRHLPLVQPP